MVIQQDGITRYLLSIRAGVLQDGYESPAAAGGPVGIRPVVDGGNFVRACRCIADRVHLRAVPLGDIRRDPAACMQLQMAICNTMT